MVNQSIGNHGLGIFWCGRIDLGPPPSSSKEEKPKLKVLITSLLLILAVCNVGIF